jgi:hypothetical protein
LVEIENLNLDLCACLAFKNGWSSIFFILLEMLLIKHGIYDLCMDFFEGKVNLQAINSSFITLIPKVNTPTNLNDFRPISLINCGENHYKIAGGQTSISGYALGSSAPIWVHKVQDNSRLPGVDL